MINTSEIAPCALLAPFVRCYTLREFNTMGADLIKPWHASHELCMVFFFKDLPLQLVNPNTGHILTKGAYGGITGMGTQYNGEMKFNGHYLFFEINFKPNGFYKLFKLPAPTLVNQIIFADEVFDERVKIFYEQLCMSKELPQMATFANGYLIFYLKKHKALAQNDAITSVSNIILKYGGSANIDHLAYDFNMSIRTFERHFTEQVGMGPKLFSSVARFNRAVSLKLMRPREDWTSIAFTCGYFDQTHLIKDFKRFAGSTPLHFFKETPLTRENYTSRAEA